MSRSTAPLPDFAARLRALADRAEADDLPPNEFVGALEALKFEVWTTATTADARPAPTGPSRGLPVEAVAERTGMSKDWLYRQARQE